MKCRKLRIVLYGIAIMLVSLGCVTFIPITYGSDLYVKSQTPITTSSNGNDVIIMSSNVRCIAPFDDTKEKSWTFRAPLFKKNIEQVNPDIVGFQEVTWIHLSYLKKILKDYDYIITYRDLSVVSEGCPIFYKKDRFELIQKDSFWLSDTPDKMSKGWGAACYRVCSYAILKDKTTNKEIVVFNTHLDHVSAEARINGINLVLSKIKDFGFDKKASVLMGDMNDFVGSSTINALFEGFNDSALVNETEANKATYQGYGKYLGNDRIDYLAVSKQGITVKDYKVIDNTYDVTYRNVEYKDVYPSDHFPIVIKTTLD